MILAASTKLLACLGAIPVEIFGTLREDYGDEMESLVFNAIAQIKDYMQQIFSATSIDNCENLLGGSRPGFQDNTIPGEPRPPTAFVVPYFALIFA